MNFVICVAFFKVAAQQGTYLAKCFDRMEECEKNPEGPIRMRGEGRHRFRPFRLALPKNLNSISSFFWLMEPNQIYVT